MTSVSRYITSASRYHPRYQSRSSMYICALIPRNFAELAEAVPIAINPSFLHAGNEDSDQTELKPSLISVSREAQCNNILKVRKRAKIRNPYNQIPHLTQNTIWESDKTQENITYKRAKRSALPQQVTTRLQVLAQMLIKTPSTYRHHMQHINNELHNNSIIVILKDTT